MPVILSSIIVKHRKEIENEKSQIYEVYGKSGGGLVLKPLMNSYWRKFRSQSKISFFLLSVCLPKTIFSGKSIYLQQHNHESLL